MMFKRKITQLTKSTFELNKKSLGLAGLSLRDHDSIPYKAYAAVVKFICITAPVNAIMTLFQNLDNLLVIVENLALAVALLVSSVKYASMWYIRDDLKVKLKALDSGIFAPNEERGGKKEDELKEKCKYVLTIYFVIFHFYPVMSMLFANMPVIQHRLNYSNNSANWILPFGGFSLFDVTKSPNFEIVVLYQTLTNFTIYIMFVGSFVTLISVIAHLACQCKILQHYIKETVTKWKTKMRSNDDDERILEWDYLKNDLKTIVIYHNAITDLANEFSDLFAFTYLVDFIGLSLVISNCLFYGFLMDSVNFRSAQMLIIALSCLCGTYFSSYWSEQFMAEYLGIGDACYEIDFIDTDVRFQKSLKLIMQRCQEPVKFMIGSFSAMTMSTFIVVAKGAYSFFMLLYHSHTKKQ